jgi:shikimate kinase
VKNSPFPFFDLDEQIETNEGKTISQIFAEEGEEYFRFA